MNERTEKDCSPTQTEFADWLIDQGLAEDRRGYGHATGDDIAERVFAHFNVTRKDTEDE